jgi:hypothetical protein
MLNLNLIYLLSGAPSRQKNFFSHFKVQLLGPMALTFLTYMGMHRGVQGVQGVRTPLFQAQKMIYGRIAQFEVLCVNFVGDRYERPHTIYNNNLIDAIATIEKHVSLRDNTCMYTHTAIIYNKLTKLHNVKC